MNTSKADSIARVRRVIKAVKVDAFMTDRFVYQMILKYARVFIKRKDDSNKLGRYSTLFQTFPGFELEESSKIEAGCVDIPSCKIYRTKETLPPIFCASYGPIIRGISSVDGYTQVVRTDAKTFGNLSKSVYFKYNKSKYYWIRDNKAYFPNLEWPAIDIDAMWENDISEFRCDVDNCCADRRLEGANIPDDVFPDIENAIREELLGTIQIPEDTKIDNRSVQK